MNRPTDLLIKNTPLDSLLTFTITKENINFQYNIKITNKQPKTQSSIKYTIIEYMFGLQRYPFSRIIIKMYKYINKIYKNFIKAKKGVTLMEIMIALLILAFAFIPIIAVIGTSTKDTDVANSYIFAQTTARNILDTLLDDVPFNSIISTESKIAKIHDYKAYKADSFLGMIGSSSDEAKGEVIDERGTKYDITIYVFPITASGNENHDVSNELLFSYLPRPKYETESDDGSNNWYTYNSGDPYMSANANDPYECEVATITKNAFELGARINDSTSEYYIMKKILFKIAWTSIDGHNRSIELYTMKANLDSDGK